MALQEHSLVLESAMDTSQVTGIASHLAAVSCTSDRVSLPIHVLLLDSQKSVVEDIRSLLTTGTRSVYDIKHVSDDEQALRLLKQGHFDVCLVTNEIDLALWLTSTIKLGIDVPIIVVSTNADAHLSETTVPAGAVDCLAALSLTTQLLERCLRYAFERRQWVSRMRTTARMDELTGLPNGQLFGEFLWGSVARSDRGKRTLGLLMVNMNRFHLLHTQVRSDVANGVIQRVAERLRGSVRAGDFVARLQAGQFGIVIDNIGGEANARTVAENIFDALHGSVRVEDQQHQVAVSIGIALYPNGNADSMALTYAASAAMHEASESGDNECRFFVGRVAESANRTAPDDYYSPPDRSSLLTSGWV